MVGIVHPPEIHDSGQTVDQDGYPCPGQYFTFLAQTHQSLWAHQFSSFISAQDTIQADIHCCGVQQISSLENILFPWIWQSFYQVVLTVHVSWAPSAGLGIHLSFHQMWPSENMIDNLLPLSQLIWCENRPCWTPHENIRALLDSSLDPLPRPGRDSWSLQRKVANIVNVYEVCP